MTILLFLALQLHASQPECRSQSLIRAQGGSAADGEFIDLGENRGRYSNPHFNGGQGAQELTSGTPVRTDAEILALVEDVRQTLIREVGEGKSKAGLSEKQRLVIRRLRALKANVEDCDATASNQSIGQTLTFCRMARTITKSALIAMIGHELGHSVDLCNLTAPYYRADFQSALELDMGGLDESHAHDLRINILRARENGGEYLLANRAPYRSAYESWERRGLITRIDQGIALEENPGHRVYACLQRTDSTTYGPLIDQNRCTASETGAQIWGARALARHLEAHPEDTRDMYATMIILGDAAADGRPGQKEREFDNLYLSEPAIQRALGCAPVSGQSCMSHFNPTMTSVRGSNPRTNAPVAAR